MVSHQNQISLMARNMVKNKSWPYLLQSEHLTKTTVKKKKRTYLEKKIMSKIEQTRHGEKQDNEGNAIW